MTIAHPAWTVSTGQHVIIPAGRQHQPASPTRPLTFAAVGLSILSAVIWWAYSHLGWDRLVTVGQILTLFAGGCLIGVGLLRAQQRQRRDDLAAVHRHIRDALGEGVNAVHGLRPLYAILAELPEELRDRQDRQAAGYQALVKEIGDRLADRLGALEQAVGAVERQVEKQGELVAEAVTAENILARANGNGQVVRSLHPPTGPYGQR